MDRAADAGKINKAQAVAERTAKQRADSRRMRTVAHTQFHASITAKLAGPRFRALYIAVARLFAEKLTQDWKILQELKQMAESHERTTLSRQISLAGKWAPTPGGSHDRPTNLSTAIALLVYRNFTTIPRPALSVSLETSALPQLDAHIVRSYYRH